MNAKMILFPALVQILLTIAIYVLLSVAKAKASQRGEVDQSRRELYDDAWPENIIKINNNIRNQFEVPILFHVLCLSSLGSLWRVASRTRMCTSIPTMSQRAARCSCSVA